MTLIAKFGVGLFTQRRWGSSYSCVQRATSSTFYPRTQMTLLVAVDYVSPSQLGVEGVVSNTNRQEQVITGHGFIFMIKGSCWQISIYCKYQYEEPRPLLVSSLSPN